MSELEQGGSTIIRRPLIFGGSTALQEQEGCLDERTRRRILRSEREEDFMTNSLGPAVRDSFQEFGDSAQHRVEGSKAL